MVNGTTLQFIKRVMFGVGIVLLIAAFALVIAFTTNLIALPEPLITGESTVHSIARLAIIGCLLAAVGAHE